MKIISVEGEQGALVADLIADGQAAGTKQIFVGDRIVAVNGIIVEEVGSTAARLLTFSLRTTCFRLSSIGRISTVPFLTHNSMFPFILNL